MSKIVAIIILNYATYEDTVNCMDSIQKFCPDYPLYKIYIVDNDSPDGSGQKLLNKYISEKNINVICSNKNLGFSGGNNLGIEYAVKDNAEYLFVINSDVLVLNDAFMHLLNFMEQNPDVNIVGPAVYGIDGKYTQYARLPQNLKMLSLEKLTMGKLGKLDIPYEIDKPFKFCGKVSGCFLGMRRNFVVEHHVFDANLFMYFEEDALAYLLKDCGGMVAIYPKARICHIEGSATKKQASNKVAFTRCFGWTSRIYVLKNYEGINRVVCYLFAGINIMVWMGLAVFDSNYRKLFKTFIKEMGRVLRAKRPGEYE